MNSLPSNMKRHTLFRDNSNSHTFVFQDSFALPAPDKIKMQVRYHGKILEIEPEIAVDGQRVTYTYTPEMLADIPEISDHYLVLDGKSFLGGQLGVLIGYGEQDISETQVMVADGEVTTVEVYGMALIDAQVAAVAEQVNIATLAAEQAGGYVAEAFGFASDANNAKVAAQTARNQAVAAQVASEAASAIAVSTVAERLPFKTISGLRLDESVTAVYVNDGRKSGTFYYDPSDTTSSDDGVMVIVSGSRRYKRQYSGTPDASWWMVADYDYVSNTGTDNGPLLQDAIAWKFANGGGDLKVPFGRYYFANDVFVNELAIPLKLIGSNGYNRNYSGNRVMGTSFIRNAPGSMFKINHKPDDTIFLQPDEQYPSFHVEGINFQCKNNYAGGVNVFRAHRFRGKFINCSCDGFDYFMYQPDQDLSTIPKSNYCDQSTYQDISISGSTLGGIRVFRADGTLLDRISFEGSATQYKYGIEVIATSGAIISRPLFWTPNDPANPIVDSSFIHLVACIGVMVLAGHVERSFFTHVVNVESCDGVSIIGLETKFSRYNGLTVTGSSFGVSMRDWKSNDTVKAGYFDINVPGSSDRQVTYDNCRFLTTQDGVDRAANVNFPTRTTVRTPAYVQTYQGSTDASITLTRGSMTMFLAAITANRTLTVPTVAQSINGDKITVINRNTSAFRWLVGNTVLDSDGTSLTYFENNKTYDLIFANGQWRVQTKYPEYTTLVSTQSGNGSSTTFNIPHGMTAAPGYFSVTPASQTAAALFWVTSDATNIVVRYQSAPASGTNNLVFNVEYKK